MFEIVNAHFNSVWTTANIHKVCWMLLLNYLLLIAYNFVSFVHLRLRLLVSAEASLMDRLGLDY